MFLKLYLLNHKFVLNIIILFRLYSLNYIRNPQTIIINNILILNVFIQLCQLKIYYIIKVLDIYLISYLENNKVEYKEDKSILYLVITNKIRLLIDLKFTSQKDINLKDKI